MTTISQILALRRIIEGAKEFNLKAIITYIDFSKAFGTINHGQMFKILHGYGIPEHHVSAIKDMYSNTQVKVQSPDWETEPFQVTSGVLQVNTLASYLFFIVLDYALQKAMQGREEGLGFCLKKWQSRHMGPVVLTDLDFTDDITLLSGEILQAQELMKRVKTESLSIGLKASAKKTKYQVYNQPEPVQIAMLDGTILEVINDFKYLGSMTSSTEVDVKCRKAVAWRTYNKLNRPWKSQLNRSIKIRVFCTFVESVLLYGLETWTLTKGLEKQLDGCYTCMLRACAEHPLVRSHL